MRFKDMKKTSVTKEKFKLKFLRTETVLKSKSLHENLFGDFCSRFELPTTSQ